MGETRISLDEAIDEYMEFKISEAVSDYYDFLSDMILFYGPKFQISPNRFGLGEFIIARFATDSKNLYKIFPSPSKLAVKTVLKVVDRHLSFTGIPKLEIIAVVFKYIELIPSWEKRIGYLNNTRSFPYKDLSEYFLERLIGEHIDNFHTNFNCFLADRIIDMSILSHCAHHLLKYRVTWMAYKDRIVLH